MKLPLLTFPAHPLGMLCLSMYIANNLNALAARECLHDVVRTGFHIGAASCSMILNPDTGQIAVDRAVMPSHMAGLLYQQSRPQYVQSKSTESWISHAGVVWDMISEYISGRSLHSLADSEIV